MGALQRVLQIRRFHQGRLNGLFLLGVVSGFGSVHFRAEATQSVTKGKRARFRVAGAGVLPHS
ncbi:MAG: hypothetical protein CBC48_14890 [bacterium TMED88]|nr:hypothetical protein [Deltaproteobacteria bacterium]OUV26814.1 MAG: hypothetical protein CBC48_14890 [bacterium TMED88]